MRLNFCFSGPRLLLLLGVVISVLIPRDASGQSRPFGAGLVLGSPTGISIKYWQNKDRALQGGIAWDLGQDEVIQIHGDFLRHRFDVIDAQRTALYYGPGVRIRFGHSNEGLGARFAFGITHLLSQDPIELFLEFAPVLNLTPDAQLILDGGLGIRYYFK